MNLDAMNAEDLNAFYWRVQRNPVTVARELFPRRWKGYVRGTKDLAAYANNKATAIQCRLRGDIQAALIYEMICDQIYTRLSPYFRTW